MDRIAGGFYIKARRIQESWIANAPPHVREIWDFILLKANYKDHGHIKRGQLLTTYREIQEGLSWFVGYRKETYKKHHCEIAMKALTRELMIATTKTTRGILITILNYDKYQEPKNYECYNENYNETTRVLQPTDTIRKEREEGRKKDIVVPPKNGATNGVPFSEIVSFFNETTERDFKPNTKSTRGYISARWNEGFRIDDFKLVVENRAEKWKNDSKMCQYLRPETVFGPKFESYLVEAKQHQSEWE